MPGPGTDLDKVFRQDVTKLVTFVLKPKQTDGEHKLNQKAENVRENSKGKALRLKELGIFKVQQLSRWG